MNSSHAKLIVDTDAGFDDFLAISWLLSNPDVTIEAFTLVNGISEVDEGADAILLLQEKAGITPPIPVYKGRTRALAGDNQFPAPWRNQAGTIIQTLHWGTPTGSAEAKTAEQFLLERLAPAAAPARILALGPLSNLGAVLRQTPASAGRIQRLVIMAGAVGPQGAKIGNIPPDCVAEGNVFVDPLAAEIVFSSAIQPSLVPLNATSQVLITRAFVESFHSSTPLGSIAGKILDIIDTEFLGPGQPPYNAWDPLAAMSFVIPGVLNNIAPLHVQVVRDGPHAGEMQTGRGAANALVALGADGDLFRKHYLSAFD